MEISTPLVGSIASGFGSNTPEISYAETDEGLKEAARDFTSIMYTFMFQAMRGNPDEQEEDGAGGNLFGGENVNMFIGFLDQEVAKKFAEQDGKDTVDALFHQLKGNNTFKDDNKTQKNAETNPSIVSVNKKS